MDDPRKESGATLANSIAMLEQILEVMPQDPDALRALYNAYRQCGRRDRAFEYLGLLVDVVIGGASAEVEAFVHAQLQGFSEEFPSQTAAQLARLRALARTEQPDARELCEKREPGEDARRAEADIGEELALAWRLYEENQLTQEEYSSVLHDLTEVSSKELDVPISVLHVLGDRGFTQMNRILNFLSARSGVPCLSLSRFELSEKAACVLPLEVAAHDGALPFAFFGNDLLVGVLNPFNHALSDQVEVRSGHRCHTFLVPPDEYDAALQRLRALAAA